MKEKIVSIKYIDAYYVYAGVWTKKIKFKLCSAYGYLTENTYDYFLTFIKDDDILVKNKKMIRGLIIPKTAVNHNLNKNRALFKNLKIGDKILLQWKDIIHVKNAYRSSSSVMETEGILTRMGNKYLVIKSPKTVRIRPQPKKNHPYKKPTFYIIPKSLIFSLKVL